MEERPDPEGRDPFPGSDILLGKSPREILGRLWEGDPLGIGRKTRDRVHELCYCLELQRLAARALAQTAYDAMDYRGTPPLEEWLTQRIDRAIEEVLERDAEAEMMDFPPDGEEAGFYAPLAELAGADPALARRLAIVFNHLPIGMREPFFDVVLGGIDLEEFAAQAATPPAEVAARIEETIATMVERAMKLDQEWKQSSGDGS